MLSYGIAGAIVFRLSLILLGTATLQVNPLPITASFLGSLTAVLFEWVLSKLFAFLLFRGLRQLIWSWLEYFYSHPSRCHSLPIDVATFKAIHQWQLIFLIDYFNFFSFLLDGLQFYKQLFLKNQVRIFE